jgi:hypothetical protein
MNAAAQYHHSGRVKDLRLTDAESDGIEGPAHRTITSRRKSLTGLRSPFH